MRILYPASGDVSHDPYEYYGTETMTVEASINIRPSEVLGPDGEPLMVGVEKPKVGFVLSAKK